MADNDDKDVGAVQEKPVLEDSVSAKDDFLEIVKTKPLTKEESTSVGVVQMLKMTLKECRVRLCRLEKMEESYNQLRVDYARIEENMIVCGKANVFWDLVLIISPLCIGLFINRDNVFSFQGLMIGVPLLLFIAAALIARYYLPRRNRRSK